MRRFSPLVLLLVFPGTPLLAQSTPVSSPPPQSARQALIEMVLGKGPNDFLKHIPDVARQTLIHKGETPDNSILLGVGMIGQQIRANGQVETFDTGAIILSSTDNNQHEKFEVLVEHDSLMGEDDEIELSLHYYKDGELQQLPVVPRFAFTFRQEHEIWKLVDAAVTVHAPLADPDYLNGLRQKQNEENENAAQMRMNGIMGAETEYQSKHADTGYSCNLSSLFPVNSGSQFYSAQPQPAVDQDGEPLEGIHTPSNSGNEDSNGYHFAITGCGNSPSTKYRLTATPTDAGMKTFCADQSGTLKFLKDGNGSACFSQGQPVNSGQSMVKQE